MHRLDKEELKKIDVHTLPDVLNVTLWVIEYLSDSDKTTFGASEIANCIVTNLGIRTSRQAVHAALVKATKQKFTHREKVGFRIMKLGQDEILKQSLEKKVIFIEPGKPFQVGLSLPLPLQKSPRFLLLHPT